MSANLPAGRWLRHMPRVTGYNQALVGLGQWWHKVTLIGKINSLSVAATLIDDMQGTRRRFEKLQARLIENLVTENTHKLEQEFSARAQAAIDILVRNLFERTADVGFLATDDDIRAFLRAPAPDSAEAIVARLREYTLKYSVYDEIIIVDPHGQVRAHLDGDNPVTRTTDPLIEETLRTGEPYVEIFRPSDLQPGRRAAHIFSAPITDNDAPGAPVIGVLCLCFRFENEMEGIFANLARPGEIITILDREGRVLAGSDEKRIPPGAHLTPGGEGLGSAIHDGEHYLARTNATRGYQGNFGLNWQGHVMRPLREAFAGRGAEPAQGLDQMHHSRIFSEELRAISRSAALVTDDLSLIVLNGQIVSAKRDANEFMPVLEEIRNIGERTKGVFDRSLANLFDTVLSSLLSEVQFQAFLAVDIMDRNLYERANDVRWWALTSRFREILARARPTPPEQEALAATLACINGLYTVYTNLLLFDAGGEILAVSNAAESALVGTSLGDAPHVKQALAVGESQAYVVSPFAPTPLYGGRYTYLYLTSVRAPLEGRVVGGIAIVFDAEPQFAAMLSDTLPRTDQGEVVEGAFGVFAERNGRVIASTREQLPTGGMLSLDGPFFALGNGERHSAIVEYAGRNYAVGAAMSQGYREYKTTGDYVNDVLALIFVPV